MKPNHYLLIAVAVVFFVLGSFMHKAIWPCPVPKPPDPALQARFDSVTTVNADLLQQIEALSNQPPITIRVRDQLRTSSSLGLDSMRADFLADPI